LFSKSITLGSLRARLSLLVIAFSLAGCYNARSQAFVAEVSVDQSEVKPGESTKVFAALTNPPDDLRIVWAADSGQLDPQANSTETVYTAPQGMDQDQDLTVKITVEFFQGNKRIGEKKAISIIVKKGDATQAQTGSGSSIPASSLPLAQNDNAQPSIQITQIPPAHPGGPVEMFRIAGRVSGVLPEGYRVVLYAQADYWYIQPFNTGDLRFTDIESDGSFSTQTHGGMAYAALLVRDSFTDPPIKTGNLPRKGKDVVAIHKIDGIR
jgi:hypothetical protein